LPGMIERQHGHILSISSLSAKFPISGCVYTTTKVGIEGLMNSLYAYLCCTGHDEYIKTTTVFPGFIATKQELYDRIASFSDAPFISPQKAANDIIHGMLRDRRNFCVPGPAAVVSIFS